VDVVVAPTFVHLDMVKSELRAPVQIAAQDCWLGAGGAFTGEVSAEMLRDFGIPWVILGHSERRSLCGEDDERVGQKCEYALSQGLKVIACIGETLEQRESGQMFAVLDAQLRWAAAQARQEEPAGGSAGVERSVPVLLRAQLPGRELPAVPSRCCPVRKHGCNRGVPGPPCSPHCRAIANHTSQGNWANMVVAYEPVWAIGTGVVATPEQAQEAHAYVRRWISDNVGADVAANLRLLYGGSGGRGRQQRPHSCWLLAAGRGGTPEHQPSIGRTNRALTAAQALPPSRHHPAWVPRSLHVCWPRLGTVQRRPCVSACPSRLRSSNVWAGVSLQ
jgi:triosephosphate isomerase